MEESINISTDSEKTLSDKIVGVVYDHLQADAESKTPIASSKEERQTLEVVPNIETPSENRNVEDDDAPLDVSPVSVYFPSNPNDVRIFGLLNELRAMVTACTKEQKKKCEVASKKKKVQEKMASPEAPSQIPGEPIDASQIRFKRPDSDEIQPMPPRNGPVQPVLLPMSQNVTLPMPPMKNPEPSSSNNKATEKKRRNNSSRYERLKVDFVLPSHVDTSGLDLDNLVPSPMDEAQPNRGRRSTRQFSFTERLLQWELEIRERPNDGRFDMFFYHGKGGSFRSIAEVTRFMMFEEYPGGKPVTGNKRKSSSRQFEVYMNNNSPGFNFFGYSTSIQEMFRRKRGLD